MAGVEIFPPRARRDRSAGKQKHIGLGQPRPLAEGVQQRQFLLPGLKAVGILGSIVFRMLMFVANIFLVVQKAETPENSCSFAPSRIAKPIDPELIAAIDVEIAVGNLLCGWVHCQLAGDLAVVE